MPTASLLGRFPLAEARTKLILDWLAAAALVALPWSTTATGLLIGVWVIFFLFTLDFAEGFRRWREPVIGLPIALCLLTIVGMLWANAPWQDRVAGALPFAKLWVLTWMVTHFARSTNVLRISLAFVASVMVLALYSWVSFFFPALGWEKDHPGIPVLDRIYLGILFATLAGALCYVAIRMWNQRRTVLAAASALCVALLVANILFVATSRTAIAVALVLIPLVLVRNLPWRPALGLLLAALLLAGTAASLSSRIQQRLLETIEGSSTQLGRAETSENLRLAYWSRALDLLRERPLLGHGTGGTRQSFGTIGGVELKQGVPNNPHNQTLMTGTQLGLVGIALLWAMWFVHIKGAWGQRWEAQMCLLIVVQNIVASIFNSHLSDFTAGWLYALGVGVLGGAIWRERAAPPSGVG